MRIMQRTFLWAVLGAIALSGISCGDDFKANLTYQKASRYHDKGNYAEAIRLYEKTLALEPDNAEVVYDLGVAYAQTREYGKAKAQAERLSQLGDTEMAAVLRSIIHEAKDR